MSYLEEKILDVSMFCVAAELIKVTVWQYDNQYYKILTTY